MKNSYITYQSRDYKPEDVTGIYIRVEGNKKRGYIFKVFETATDKKTGKFGQGFTLREYLTAGKELPEDAKQKAIETKQMVKVR